MLSMKEKEIKATIVIIVMTAIWGGTFPLVKSMLKYVSPVLLITLRFFFAAICALPVFVKQFAKYKKELPKLILLGAIMYSAYLFQTIGLHFTTASKSGFITGLYIVFTPVLALVIIKEKPTFKLILSLFLAMLGLALLSGITPGSFSINKGDLITILCAVAYSVQIVLTNIYAKDIDIAFITAVQMITMFLVSIPFSAGHLSLRFPLWVWVSLAFLGSIAGYFAILAETYSLKYLDPDRASVLFTFEPVFAGITAYVFLKESLTKQGIIGAALILVAMWLAIKAKPATSDT